MNPFKTSTEKNPKKSPSKQSPPKKSPSQKSPLQQSPSEQSSLGVSSASTSSDVLTTADTHVRKPFHQICLEEIARKSKIAPTPQSSTKNVECLSSKSTSVKTEKKQRSIAELSEALQQLRILDQTLDESNSDDESSKCSLKASGSTTSPSLKSSNLSQDLSSPSYVSSELKDLDLLAESFHHMPEVLKTSEKSSIGSAKWGTESSNTSTFTSKGSQKIPELLSFYEDFYEEPPEVVDIFEPLDIPSFVQNPVKSTLKCQLKHDGSSEYQDKPSTSASETISHITTDIPAFKDSPLKSSFKSQLKHGDKNDYNNEPSTSKNIQDISVHVPAFGENFLYPSFKSQTIQDISTDVIESPIKSSFKFVPNDGGPDDNKQSTSACEKIPDISTGDSAFFKDTVKPFKFQWKCDRKRYYNKPSPSTSFPIISTDVPAYIENPLLRPQLEYNNKLVENVLKSQPQLGGKSDYSNEPSTSTSIQNISADEHDKPSTSGYKSIEAISSDEPGDVIEYYRKRGAIPKKFVASKSGTSMERQRQKSIPDVTKKEKPSVSKVLDKKDSKTERVIKAPSSVPSVTLKDIKLSGLLSTSKECCQQESIPDVTKKGKLSVSKVLDKKKSKTETTKEPSVTSQDIKLSDLSTSEECCQQESIRKVTKKEKISVTIILGKKDSKTERVTKTPSSGPLVTLKDSEECYQQESIPKVTKKEKISVAKVLDKKDSKTERITKAPSSGPSVTSRDTKQSDISPYSWKFPKETKPSTLSNENISMKIQKFREFTKSRRAAGGAVEQSGETSSLKSISTAETSSNDTARRIRKSSNLATITEGQLINLGDFKHDLGEAILDSVFFENDVDDSDNYIDYVMYDKPSDRLKDRTKSEDTFEEKGSAAENVSELTKLLHSRQCCGQGGGADSPDLEFIYDDTDTHGNEIAELYSYTEQPELQLNVKAFEDQMECYNLPPSWQRLSVEKRKSVVMKLLDQLEVSKKNLRMRSARCLLYIAQGCWAEMQSDTEQQHWARINCMLLYQLGAYCAFTDLLNIEIENSTAAHVAMRKIAVSLADSQDLRVILSVLYTITEVIRNEKATDNSEYKSDVDAFCDEIGNASGDELLVIKLLGMVTRFCSGAAPHFPMKKVLLLLWKLILVSLGGMTTLKDLKAEKRQRAGLPPQDEDTMEIARTMRSSSPPASASDLLEAQNQKRNTRPFKRSLMKQSSLDDQESLGMEMETTMGNDNGDDLADMTEYDERRPSDNSDASQMYNNHNINMYNRQMSPPPQHDILPRGLPWKPKVRQKDIDFFLDSSRQKFLGYSLPGDRDTLFGLPEPIHEGVRILKDHVYTSLAELQIQKEEEIARNPLSTDEEEIDSTPAEMLYQAMLPNLPQYMIALLKILLAAAPTSKAKADSINIMADVLPEEMPMTVLQSMKLGIDVNRHKEIIVKAVSAVLLLLLKHLKLNHIYQFEFMSQHLVFANCIPLVLKFFNQNIMAYVGAKNVIPILDFPSCVIGDQPELTAESLEIGDAAAFSWRNMFSCINLLRILNKLTKWKHSRIMMLVVFKSSPILKRTLKVRHAMTQLYVLKLLKMQTKYLGRQWRKSNMKTISAIYQKVRHRLNDDWAYGNDLDARPWDFQAEECALRASVDRFNNRRYGLVTESDFEPVDNCLSSVLGASHELSDNFKTYYNLWLEQEVYGTPIEWDRLVLDDGSL